jgi:hypothetical protein
MVEELTYLIWYDGEKGLSQYCGTLQELGFVKLETLYLKSLDQHLVRCRYEGSDSLDSITHALSLDERIRIDVDKEYLASEKA